MKISSRHKEKKQERFGLVKADVILDPDLSVTAKAVYAALSTFANKERLCHPSILHISELLGVNRRTVERAIVELKDKDYVKKEGREFSIK